MKLAGKKISILIAGGDHEHELWFPYYRFKEEDAEVMIGAPKAGRVVGADRRITCPHDMADDVTHAGGQFVDAPAVRDGNIITAVYFGYLPGRTGQPPSAASSAFATAAESALGYFPISSTNFFFA